MGNKIWFAFALIAVVWMHVIVLQSYKIKQKIIAVPAKTISKTINLQRVAIKKPPPVVEKAIVPTLVIEPPKVVQKPKKKKIVKKKRIRKPIPKPESKKVEKVVEKVAEPVVAPSPMPMISTARVREIEESYLSKVRVAIERHKRYPKSAKRLRQEGVVSVEFEIEKDGRIFYARVSKASRYKKLNKAALKILQNIGRFDPIPEELGKSSWTITVPIAYKIIES